MALVVLPFLAPSLNKSLKEDKSLYPVRTLRYYLAKTKDLCKGKNLAFRKSFIRILFQLPSLPGARELCCNATSFLMSKPRAYIKSEPMVFKPLLLPRHSQGVSPWTKSSQPARGRSIIFFYAILSERRGLGRFGIVTLRPSGSCSTGPQII